MTKTMTIVKFLNRTSKDENGCWVYKGCKLPGKFNYGWMSFRGTQMRTHRVAWTLFNGEIPTGKCVLHKCDNPPCCNPRHLFLGTYSDNMKDMWNKGRHPKPNGCSNAKLNPRQVFFIKNLLGKVPQSALGEMFGVGQSTIGMISIGKNWRSI